jgi:hypothetical protein
VSHVGYPYQDAVVLAAFWGEVDVAVTIYL